ncbi:hypothetical protein AOA60_03015, partial [Pseudomonas sp. 2822-17]
RSNSSHLNDETKIEGKESNLNNQIKWKNRIFILFTVLFILLILNFNLVQALFQRIIDFIGYIFASMSNLLYSGEDE